MEKKTLTAFFIVLAACIFTGFPVQVALAAGFVIFFFYGRKQGFPVRELFKMAGRGIYTTRNIVVVLLLVGVLTALWRASGTIPALVCYFVPWIHPSVFLLMTFLLNSFLSVLTGTSFGTAATMGVICMSVGNTMGTAPYLTGGAILSGIFFGDRCSPVSSSALLVCELTGTNIYENVIRMVKTAFVPFVISCLLYLLLGLQDRGTVDAAWVTQLFEQNFTISPMALLPAAVILVLSFLRVDVKFSMAVSCGVAFVMCLAVQHMTAVSVIRTMIEGYCAGDKELARMIDGGGLCSMVSVVLVVCLAASYSGFFEGTKILKGIQSGVEALSRRITVFGSIVCTSVASAMVACNQTLPIILTYQLCNKLEQDKQEMAIDLEDSAVVLAALIPWSIAGSVPLATVGAPMSSLLFAFFLYLIPMWRWMLQYLFTASHRQL